MPGTKQAGLTGIAVCVLALTAGCTSEPPGDSTFDPGMGHIHALAINPANGTVYAGTHYGLFTLTDSGAERVGSVVQDFMGLAAAGDDHFLASGHPSPDDMDQPVNLGLIESRDGGDSWDVLSLSGAADFHALEYKHGIVYGYDSLNQQIMVSDDKHEWIGGARFPAYDIAVSPLNPDEVIATVERGPARSTDRGEMFEVLGGAPALVFVDWPAEDELVGIDANGVVYVSADGGDSWREMGTVGAAPHALLAAGDGEIYVATDRVILSSGDNGATFTPLWEPAQ